MPPDKTKEPQYQACVEHKSRFGAETFGLMSGEVWANDPKRITFLLSRYKFVGKMFAGLERVLEIGCADAFGTRVVAAEVGELTAVDFDPLFVDDALSRMNEANRFDCFCHDILEGPVPTGAFDGVYALDVLEHIEPDKTHVFLRNVVASLAPHGATIIGMPSKESQLYASPQSKEGHVNCMSGDEFRDCLIEHFHNVFLFSMNDEVVHTGFNKMAHYLLTLCCGPKSGKEGAHG